MYKKASTRTGGSNLSGWNTRKQTEPKIDRKQTELVTDWDKIQPRRKKSSPALPNSNPRLVKKSEVVRPKDNFRRALKIQAKKIRDASKTRREIKTKV